ncbi:caspase family protein [Streptosporangium sp. NBC_01810]|uniref:caspase, EACC1-associated type n=1 Tax=Streptosporangium sp. NBC_01810 TaxID=2975951 RepID=UPI002DDBCB46|nr:caspase family protein [Streptosporangium sp. NBC_01810]WSA27564.1 caspase family protein [Streptosporangium sp. NBC_01810]
MVAEATPRLLLSGSGVRVLIVGSGRHVAEARIRDVPQAVSAATDLATTLVEHTDLAPEQLTLLVNPDDPARLATAIDALSQQATDVLVFVYVGHGLIGPDNRLYLATQATVDLTQGPVRNQALPYAEVADLLSRSRARLSVVILDCCWAGRATGWPDTYLLTSTSRDETAWALPGDRHTAFTGALIHLLTEGDPTGPYLLGLDDVHRCLTRGLRERGMPVPRRQAADHGGRPIVVNAAYRPPAGHRFPAALPDDGQHSPYRGLRAYRAEDTAFFFGREALTHTLADRVTSERGAPLVVTGPSGSGKSSVLQAGLIAALGSERCLLLTPGADPFGGLLQSVTDLTGGSRPDPDRTGDTTAEREQLLATPPGPDRLGDTSGGRQRLITPPDPDRLWDALPEDTVLLIDQFEEVFTLCEDESRRAPFIRALVAISRKVPVVIGVRADFFGHCTAYPGLVDALEHAAVVPPLTRDQLRDVIEEPARLAGLTLDEGLVEQLLDDLGDSTDSTPLPLLSHALLATWQRREDGVLTLAAYRATGGITQALARTADETLNSLHSPDLLTTAPRSSQSSGTAPRSPQSSGTAPRSPQSSGTAPRSPQSSDTAPSHSAKRPPSGPEPPDSLARDTARRMFLRLVRLGEATDDTRRTVPLLELLPAAGSPEHDQARVVLDAFTRARLITVDQDRAHIVHEALIRAWPQLRSWIDADRADLLVGQQLSEDAARWDRQRREPGYLYTGARLEAIDRTRERWRSGPTRHPFLNEVVADFLTSSDAAAKRARRRRRVTLVTLIVLLIASLGGAGAAVLAANDARTQQRLAEARSQEATSRERALQSEYIAAADPVRSAALAANAWRVARTPEARYSVLDILAGAGRGIIAVGEGSAWAVAYSPDGKTLAVSETDGTIRLWDVATRRPIGTPLTGHPDDVRGVAFSPDGKTMATTAADKAVRLWDVATRRPLGAPLTGHTDAIGSAFNPVNGVLFSPDGRTLATAGNDGTVRLWDVATHRPLGAPLTGHKNSVIGLAYSPDGHTLASAGFEGTVHLWDVTAHRQLGGPFDAAAEFAWTVAFSPDGRILASAGSDGIVHIWDVAAHRRRGEPLTGHKEHVLRLAFSPDGRVLASAGADGTVRLWNIATHREVATLTGHRKGVQTVAFSPDGRTLASAGDDGTVRLWDVATHRPLGAPLTGHGGRVLEVAFTRDGRGLASAGIDGSVRRWNIAGHSGDAVLPPRREGSVSALALSADARALAIADTDESVVRLWDLSTGQERGNPFAGHQDTRNPVVDSINSVAFSPDGRSLASGGADGTIRLWDTTTHRQLGDPLTGHTASSNGLPFISGVTFSPDGGTLASAGGDGTARLWGGVAVPADSDLSRLICPLAARSPYSEGYDEYTAPPPDQGRRC